MMSTSDVAHAPGTVVVIFRSRLRETAVAHGYLDVLREMSDLARTMPGFIDERSFTSADGEQLTVVRWHDYETLAAWREHTRHRTAQRLGREHWYDSYTMDVATVVRTTSFQRPSRAAHGGL